MSHLPTPPVTTIPAQEVANVAVSPSDGSLRQKVEGISAVLLPYLPNGEVAVESFVQHLIATHRAGLINAVNVDTGYANYLSDSEKREVLRWTREALGKSVPFVAGAYIDNGGMKHSSLSRKLELE